MNPIDPALQKNVMENMLKMPNLVVFELKVNNEFLANGYRGSDPCPLG